MLREVMLLTLSRPPPSIELVVSSMPLLPWSAPCSFHTFPRPLPCSFPFVSTTRPLVRSPPLSLIADATPCVLWLFLSAHGVPSVCPTAGVPMRLTHCGLAVVMTDSANLFCALR
jgi:hypothetical protein